MRGVDLWVITGSGAACAGAIFLPSACVRWRGLGQDKGARAGVAHRLRCATPGGGVVCHRAGTLPPVRDAGLAGAGQPTCARLASHPWPLASLSGPAVRVPSLAWPLRGRPGGAFACPAPARRRRWPGEPVWLPCCLALPLVPACRPSRTDGGDTGIERRNRCYRTIDSIETMFLCIGRTRRAHGRAWTTFPTRQAGMWANDAIARPGALSPALPVSALLVTARPMCISGCGWLDVCWIVCVRSALSLWTQERRGGF